MPSASATPLPQALTRQDSDRVQGWGGKRNGNRNTAVGPRPGLLGADISSGSISSALQKALGAPQHLSHGAAFLQHIADCSKVIPADRVYPYGASFSKSMPEGPESNLVDRLERFFQELLVEADSHKADYVLIHSLEIKVGLFVGDDAAARVQMLNAIGVG